jgi:hypothetical protein
MTKEEPRPVNLKFFSKATTARFQELCRKHSIAVTVKPDATDKDADQVSTHPLTTTERRKLIAEWASATMETSG